MLAWRGLREPHLYKGLTAMVIWDPCFLKESMWNSAHSSFSKAATFIKLTETSAGELKYSEPKTSPKTARGHVISNWTRSDEVSSRLRSTEGWKGLEPGSCEDFSKFLTLDLGFEPERVHRVSLFDRLASPKLKDLVFHIQKSGNEDVLDELAELVTTEVQQAQHDIEQQLDDPTSEASRLMALLEVRQDLPSACTLLG